MKITNHIDQNLLTHTYLYPFDRLRNKLGPRLEHPDVNRSGNAFLAGKMDVLRSYNGTDVFAYSDKGKSYVIPSAASIQAESWPDARGPAKDPTQDMRWEYDAIRNFDNKGNKLSAPSLIDHDLLITGTRPFEMSDLGFTIDPVTGDGYSKSNDWSKVKIPRQDRKSLPARTFVAYKSWRQWTDVTTGAPMDVTFLVYTGKTPGVQHGDGAIYLYNFLPSPETPLVIHSS